MSFIRVKKVNGKEYRYEVESYRDNGKVRQRVLRYLGPDDRNAKSEKKNFRSRVQKNGMAWISVSRAMAGKEIEGNYRVME